MEVEPPWEALDVDDSDIPSLLRPCQRRHTHNIPGPAGAVQSAMLRKTLDRQNRKFADNNFANGLISTQDYVRKAVEDTVEFDEDFTRHPWLSALEFLGVGEGTIPSTPISSIKKCMDIGEADQVVAVIKSCKTSGLGGLIVTLKDPTGTVGASIHSKVLSEIEFRRKITVGSVLILQKVAIFSPVRSTQYLNITLRNLVKVFCHESDPPSNQKIDDFLADNNHPECLGKTNTLEKMPTMQSMEIEVTTKKSGLSKEKESLIPKQNLFAQSSQSNNRTSSNLGAAVRREPLESSQYPSHGPPGDKNSARCIADRPYFVSESDKCAKGGTSESARLSSILSFANFGTNKNNIGDEIEGSSEVQTKPEPLILKPSLPQWTDEQLDELFAGDEDGGSLF